LDIRDPAPAELDFGPTSYPDRRSSYRQPDPACPRCEYEWISVTLRTALDFHCECQVCGETWAVLKPAATLH
jgi:hypothetical protein